MEDAYKQLAKELHRRAVYKFPRLKVPLGYKDHMWGMDLMDMKNLQRENKEAPYLLTVIDIATRYGWAIPIPNKSGKTMARVLADLFSSAEEDGHKPPESIWVDQGKEFYNKEIAALLEQHGTKLFSTYGEPKSAVVERFNQTLGNWLWKAFTEIGNRQWSSILPELVKFYNEKKHRTLGISPVEATKLTREEFEERFGEKEEATPAEVKAAKTRKTPFEPEDLVRVSVKKRAFEKGRTERWSRSIFRVAETIVPVDKTQPVTYRLFEYSDKHGKRIKKPQELRGFSTGASSRRRHSE